jgi:hypothetical protein
VQEGMSGRACSYILSTPYPHKSPPFIVVGRPPQSVNNFNTSAARNGKNIVTTLCVVGRGGRMCRNRFNRKHPPRERRPNIGQSLCNAGRCS